MKFFKKQGVTLLSLSMVLGTTVAMADANSAVGTWKTIDDVTGKPTSYVQIYSAGSSLQGRVVKLLPDAKKSVCDVCPGSFKNKPITGMVVMWGYQPKGDGSWTNGHIIDPNNGKIYKSNLSVSGNTLNVRGYIGFSALGRTQNWYRVK